MKQTRAALAIEWLEEEFSRSVIVRLDYATPAITLEKPRGGTLRRMDLSNADAVRLGVTRKTSRLNHGIFVVISVRLNYDMVGRVSLDY